MTRHDEIKILKLENCESKFFEPMVKLWRQNSKTLGYMPKMGFVQYANNGTILVAVKGGVFIAYLMYGVSRGWARLIHLSVSSSSSRSGVAMLLLQELKRITFDFDGIFLSCRKDYGIDGLWEKAGFNHCFDRPGRSQSGRLVSRWVYEHTPNAVFICANEHRSVGEARAVIDTNVFLDIIDETRPNHEVALALQDGECEESLQLWVTKELGTEVRDNSVSKAAFNHFQLAQVDQHASEAVAAELARLHPPKNKHSVSDQRQLATAIAFEADYFITRDDDIINTFGDDANKYDIQILTPEQALLMQDEILNASKYIRQPIGHSQWTISLVTASDIQGCSSNFFLARIEKRPADLHEKIKSAAIAASGMRLYIMRDNTGSMTAMWLYVKADDGLHLSLIRYRHAKARYKEAVHRRILMHALEQAAELKGDIVHLTVRLDCASEAPILRVVGEQLGFVVTEGKLSKIVMPFTAPGLHDQRIAKFSTVPNTVISPRSIYNTERQFWPLKIKGFNLGAVIIPIQTMWFERLFGGQQLCIDVPVFIALNDDQVYYRSRMNGAAIQIPSRIVWYIAKGRSGQGAMSYAACSYLDSMEIGAAKQIFEKHKKFGAFTWSEIAQLTKGDGSKDIMALRFSMTEVFKTRIPRKPIGDDIIKRHGHAKVLSANLVAPVRISDAAFHELYALAMS